MNSTKTVMEPASFRTIDEVGDDVEGVWVVEFRIYDVRNCFVIEVDLSYQDYQIEAYI